jgi:hypothetical protein
MTGHSRDAAIAPHDERHDLLGSHYVIDDRDAGRNIERAGIDGL